MRYEVNVILRVDDNSREPATVEGEIESRYGRQSFSGWLELLGRLEAIADRARAEPGRSTVRGERSGT